MRRVVRALLMTARAVVVCHLQYLEHTEVVIQFSINLLLM